ALLGLWRRLPGAALRFLLCLPLCASPLRARSSPPRHSDAIRYARWHLQLSRLCLERLLLARRSISLKAHLAARCPHWIAGQRRLRGLLLQERLSCRQKRLRRACPSAAVPAATEIGSPQAAQGAALTKA